MLVTRIMIGAWRVCPKSNKGSGDRQFIGRFVLVKGQGWGTSGRLYLAGQVVSCSSGTRLRNQGGVSSAMPWNFLAVLLAGIPSNKAPRWIVTSRNR